MDAATYDARPNLPDVDDGVEVRRARLFTEGKLFLFRPIDYKVEFGVANESVFLNDFYLGLHDRLTAAVGWFSSGIGDDTGDASDGLSRFVGRITSLPYDDESSGTRRLVHLGLSGSRSRLSPLRRPAPSPLPDPRSSAPTHRGPAVLVCPPTLRGGFRPACPRPPVALACPEAARYSLGTVAEGGNRVA